MLHFDIIFLNSSFYFQVHGPCKSLCSGPKGDHIFVGKPDGLSVLNAETSETIDEWKDDKMDIVDVIVYKIEDDNFLISTIDDMGNETAFVTMKLFKYICSIIQYLQKLTFYYPDSIPPSDRRWLLVAWSADFADVVGLPTNTLVRCLYILPTLGQRWADVGLPTNTQVRCLYFANVGPTADFYSRWRRAIIGDLG